MGASSNFPLKKDPDKGQHFLISPDILIAHSNMSKNDRIIEIGAGEGILTSELAKRAGNLTAFEIDKRYSSSLCLLESRHKNLKIIYDNALKHSWLGYNKIISNIPFFISEQIILKAIDEEIDEMLLIMGDKFRRKLENKESKIGIVANRFYNIEFMAKIDKKYFSPPPRGCPWLVRFAKKPSISERGMLLKRILRGRGKLKNSISHSLVLSGKTKRESREILASLNIFRRNLEKPVQKTTAKMLIKLISDLEKILKK